MNTLLYSQANGAEGEEEAWKKISRYGKDALDFLIFNEIISQKEANIDGKVVFNFEATKLGLANIKSNLSPEEGLMVYLDLQIA